jgi:hypothetical protein
VESRSTVLSKDFRRVIWPAMEPRDGAASPVFV